MFMQLKNSRIRGGLAKTLLIILGVIIAFLMTFNSPLFTAENQVPGKSEPRKSVTMGTTGAEKDEKHSSSGSTYNSGARLFDIFTKNLPYLNNK